MLFFCWFMANIDDIDNNEDDKIKENKRKQIARDEWIEAISRVDKKIQDKNNVFYFNGLKWKVKEREESGSKWNVEKMSEKHKKRKEKKTSRQKKKEIQI